MRFNCGPTKAEKKKALREYLYDKGERLYEHGVKHFALLPVRLENGECAWLEFVTKKLRYKYSNYLCYYEPVMNKWSAGAAYRDGKKVKYKYWPIDKY